MSQYVITDGFRYVYRNFKGKYTSAPGISMADKYSKKQAENILNNCVPKCHRKGYRVEKIGEPCVSSGKSEENRKNESENNSQKDIQIPENLQDWVRKISSMNGIADEIAKRKTDLWSEVSTVDREISDIMHYIESTTNLNAAQGYKMYKMLKERRIKRRKIKNEIEILHLITEKMESNPIAQEVIRKATEMENRIYKPKELKDLFKDNEKR